jgi:hypothetical protein
VRGALVAALACALGPDDSAACAERARQRLAVVAPAARARQIQRLQPGGSLAVLRPFLRRRRDVVRSTPVRWHASRNQPLRAPVVFPRALPLTEGAQANLVVYLTLPVQRTQPSGPLAVQLALVERDGEHRPWESQLLLSAGERPMRLPLHEHATAIDWRVPLVLEGEVEQAPPGAYIRLYVDLYRPG